MRILLVVAHPRTQSLTHAAADAFAEAATAAGHTIEWADLMAEGFDPVLREADEPDWSNATKAYSPAVEAEMARIRRNEATVMVFPVWWWSMPALLKGWIDRVWNNGFAYGDASYPHARALMIGVAGTDEKAYQKRGYDQAMQTALETGILGYCRIADGRLELLYGSMDGEAADALIIARARELGAAF
ncbi:MAG: NAD(P)H oxidoreductase [Hyphomicrobium sp.]|uniref:NAD(P)H oxidoreductase n=1 Tax=Hyphomicrobium sp. TaxID=82 RepID=UPI003D135A86